MELRRYSAKATEQGPKLQTDPAITVLEELLALRTIVSTILFRIANGQKLPDDQMAGLIEKADGSKRSRAEELLRGAK